ncbi:unnamed protein product [Phytophthora fragariaefolia]|uniref:Unnamed protein product n=1 Tax=Phytophthora fragariaefolia TaxID=1490495 RepID=A0A9W6U630_9STRA|nr:unnamed protein product [Phytophthora fragariaefolia]
MAIGSSSAVPATPMKSGGMRGDNSSMALITSQLDSIAERSVSFDEDAMTGSDAKDDGDLNEGNYDLEEKAPAPMAVAPDAPEDAVMFAGRKPIYEDFEDDGDNSKSPIVTTQVTEQATGNRPPISGDTPAANKVLGKCYEDIKSSDWGECLFEPTMIRQVVWSELSNELAWPVNSTTIELVAKDTVAVLQAMGLKRDRASITVDSGMLDPCGCRCRVMEVEEETPFGLRNDQVLLQAAEVQQFSRMFSTTTGRSPYFQDSHMVTPRSAKCQERVDRAADNSNVTENTRRGTGKSLRRRYQPDDDSSSEDEGYDGDGGVQMNEYMRQIRELTDSEQSNATPRIEAPARADALASLLDEASAEDSERVIAVLGSRLEAMTRMVVGLHLEPAIRDDRRVRSKLEAAKCLDEVIPAAVPDPQVGTDNSLDVAVLRAQVYAAETAQAASERALAKETFRRENAAAVTSSTKALTRLWTSTRNSTSAWKIASRLPDDSVQRLSSQLSRERETVKAAVASNTAPSRRLHNLLSTSIAADSSKEVQLRRRAEDLQERVERLVTANRVPRARVKHEEMDPDTLALVTEGEFSSFTVAAWGGCSPLRGSRSSSQASSVGHQRSPSSSRCASGSPSKVLSRANPRAPSSARRIAAASSQAASRAFPRAPSPTRPRASSASRPSRSAAGLSRDDSQATIALSDDEVEIVGVSSAATQSVSVSRLEASTERTSKNPKGSRRGPILRDNPARSEFRSALLLEVLEADDDDVLGSTELSPASSRGTSRERLKSPAALTLRSASPRDATVNAVGSPVAPGTRLTSSCSTSGKPEESPAASTTHSTSSHRASVKPVELPAAPTTRSTSSRRASGKPEEPPAAPITRQVNSRASNPTSHTRVPCTVTTLEAFVDYNNPIHPWQRLRRNLPPQACLFDTSSIDPNCKISQRPPIPLRLRGYWRMFRGFGNETDASMGFAFWERDHWVPTRAVEAYFEVAYRALDDSFDEASRPSLRASVDAAKDRWLAYVRERAQRSDRLRHMLICTLWEWCLSDQFPDVEMELMFEQSMPGYSLEHLTWVPQTADWFSELPALEEKEPWRNSWTEVPARHPYNTTFVPYNPSFPLFIPVGFSWDSVRRQVVQDPSLDFHEISTSWLHIPSAPSFPDESASDVPRLPTGPVQSSLPTPTSDDQLRMLIKVATAASDDVTEF